MKYLISSILVLSFFLIPQTHAQTGLTVYTLEQANDLALRNHPTIHFAEEGIIRSKILPEKARSEILPYFNIFSSYGWKDEDVVRNGIEIYPQEQGQLDVNLVQPIFNAIYFPTRDKAFLQIDSSIEKYYGVVQDILYQVNEAYYKILESKELIAVAQEYEKLAEDELQIATVKYKAGDVTEDVPIRSEMNVTKAQNNIITAQDQLILWKGVLKSLTDIKESDFEVLPPTTLHSPGENTAELYEIALNHRHDYLMAVNEVNIAELNIDINKSRFWPSLDGSLNYRMIDNPGYYEEDEEFEVAVKFTVPLYHGGIRHADLKDTRVIQKQANLHLNAILKDIEIEIKNSLVNIESHQSTLKNLKKQAQLADKNFQIAQNKFRYGAAIGLELDAALTTLNAVKTDEITTSYKLQMEILNLQKVIGIFVQEKLHYQ